MKKIISVILSASILAAFTAVPVFADYTAPEGESSYDVIQYEYNYDDGEATNAIDSTNAKKITDEERLLDGIDSKLLANEFYLSFDFCFDSAEDGSVPGSISIDKKKSTGAVDKQGPLFSYSEGILRTQTGSGATSYQTIAAISPDTWYTAEIEGKMVVSDAAAVMRIYDAEHNEISVLENLNLRQFYAGSDNGSPNTLRASNISVDNLKLISEYPDTITVTADSDSVKAGQTNPLKYTMTRLEKTMTNYDVEWSVYDVEWSVYDENNENEITDGSVSVSGEGVLIASISSPSQIVTVRATAQFGEKELVGTKQIEIKEVNTSDEKYDTIVISGEAAVKAGTSAQYSFTASKDGVDVTDSVTDEDVVWSIYNCDDLSPNNNNAIKVENGVLTVDSGVLPQTVYIRATSPSGNVYGSKKAEITFADSQIETVLAYDPCETALASAERVTAIDGSAAYYTSSDTIMCKFTNTTEYTLTEFDLKFSEDGSGGVTLIRQDDGKQDLQLGYSDGIIRTQTGGSSYSTVMTGASTDVWYHFELMYGSAYKDASCNIYEYAADGSLGEKKTFFNLGLRNGDTYGALKVWASTYIDNIKISTPIADEVSITSPGQYVFAGGTAQFTASAARNSLPIKSVSALTWTALDSDLLPILDDTITISDSGLLTVDAMAEPQTVTVRVSTSTGAKADAQITVQVSEIFSVDNIGINEAGDKIVRLYVDKNFYYDDEVVFIIAIKNSEGCLKAVKLINTFGERLGLGNNELTTDFSLPSDFNPETDVIETMVWTSVK